MNTKYDMPGNYYFGGGGEESFFTPLAVVVLLCAIVLMLALPRKWLIVPFLAAGVILPYGITLVLFGLHFTALRILVAAGLIRLVTRRDLTIPRLSTIDTVYFLWAVSNAVAFSILWGTSEAVINRAGFLWTTLGVYLMVRILIREKSDIVFAIRVLATLSVIIAVAMEVEHISGHNIFSVLGAPELADIRNGAIRARGPFGHPIIAGTMGSVMMPIFVGLWWQEKRYRVVSGAGVAASLIMVVTSASATPLLTCSAGVIALLMWGKREHLRPFVWLFVAGVVSLHLVMKAPVWFLIARAGSVLGSSGYHRAMLIDNFIRHFGEWWLVGTQNNALWGYDMWDVDNAYVAAGVSGGIVTFVLFVALLIFAFREIAKSLRQARRRRQSERLIWALGSCVFCNAVGYLGIVYFDQSVVIWCIVLTLVSVSRTLVATVRNDSMATNNVNTVTSRLIACDVSRYSFPWS